MWNWDKTQSPSKMKDKFEIKVILKTNFKLCNRALKVLWYTTNNLKYRPLVQLKINWGIIFTVNKKILINSLWLINKMETLLFKLLINKILIILIISKRNNWIILKITFRNTKISICSIMKTFWSRTYSKTKIIIRFNLTFIVNRQKLKINIKDKNCQLNQIMEVREIWTDKFRVIKKWIWNFWAQCLGPLRNVNRYVEWFAW